jgi:hypothetical protein
MPSVLVISIRNRGKIFINENNINGYIIAVF